MIFFFKHISKAYDVHFFFPSAFFVNHFTAAAHISANPWNIFWDSGRHIVNAYYNTDIRIFV